MTKNIKEKSMTWNPIEWGKWVYEQWNKIPEDKRKALEEKAEKAIIDALNKKKKK